MWLPVISPLGRYAMQIACRATDGPDFLRLLVNAEVDPAPDAPLGTAMLACVSLAVPLDLDPRTVDQQMQRALGTAVRDIHGQGFLARR